MEINKRIGKIKKYFKELSVYDELNVVFMTFPTKWLDNDYTELSKKNNVVIQQKDGDLLFFNDMNVGLDPIFDVIDYIIEFNNQLEMKSTLFKSKIEELKNIFATESLDKLETLTFTFSKIKKNKNKKSVNKESPIVSIESHKESGEVVIVEHNIDINIENNEVKDGVIKDENNNSLIDFVKNEIL